MDIPKYENVSQWLRYLESERLRIRREMCSREITASALSRLQGELQLLDEDIQVVQRRMQSDSWKLVTTERRNLRRGHSDVLAPS